MDYYPLTQPQRAVWDRMFGSGSGWLAGTVTFDGPVELSILKDAVNWTLRCRDALRIRIVLRDEVPMQYFEPFQPEECRERTADPPPLPATPEELSGARLASFESGTLPDGRAVLHVSAHRLALDEESFRMVCADLVRTCRELSKGNPARGGGHSYRTFLRDDQSYRTGKRCREDREYWRSRLPEISETRRPHPPRRPESARAGTLERSLSPAVSENVRLFAARNRLEPGEAFAAAYAVCLSRACGADRIVLWTEFPNREGDEERQTAGRIAEWLPVSLSVKGGMEFSGLCGTVRQELQTAGSHAKFGQAALRELREGAWDAGFAFAYSEEIRGNVRTFPERSSGALLKLQILPEGGVFTVRLTYRESYYEAPEMELLFRQLETLLTEAASKNGIPLSALNGWPEADKERVKNGFNSRVSLWYGGETAVSIFQKTVEKYMDRPALISPETRLTYGELDRLSGRISRELLALGAKPEETAAILLPRSPMLAAALLGVLKSGCAFLLLDPEHPESCIQRGLIESGARFCLTVPESILPSGCIGIFPEALSLEFPGTAGTLPQPVPGGICCLSYQPDASGRPARLRMDHRAFAAMCAPDASGFHEAYTRPGGTAFCIGTAASGTFLQELFLPLLNGIPVYLPDGLQAEDPEELAWMFRDSPAVRFFCNAALFAGFLENVRFAEALERADAVLLTGDPGAAVPVPEGSLGGNRAYTGYTLPEAAGILTAGPADQPGVYGKQAAGARIFILSEDRKLLPPGAEGEIAIGGDRLLGTGGNERRIWFEGERVLLTGDTGYFTSDGDLIRTGRRDRQINLFGIRIEPAEVEAAVASNESVGQCAVTLRNVSGHPVLCCFCTAKREISPEAVREYAKTRLPREKVPGMAVLLPELPLTSKGLIDSRALGALPLPAAVPESVPANETEEKLCEAFAEALGVERISPLAPFYWNGGTLRMVPRVTEAAARRGIPIRFPDLLRRTTARELAAALIGAASSHAPEDASLYDYREIRRLLAANQLPVSGGRGDLGAVLLTGATGYLGAHVLYELALKYNHPIYCLVRQKNGVDPEKRLMSSLFYYFETSLASLFGNRLFVLEGDLTFPEIFTSGSPPEIRSVIHCAAHVTHLSDDESLRAVNVQGTRNLLRFCHERDAAFIHVSTTAIGGFLPPRKIREGTRFQETSLYLGQSLSSAYLKSKFLAERDVLEARCAGLKAKIMRIGNLQGRITDGEFQMNLSTNRFHKQVQSCVKLGMCPQEFSGQQVNFSPVDMVASALLTLARTPPEYSVFHLYDEKSIPVSRIFQRLERIGYPVRVMKDSDFAEAVSRLPEADGYLSGLIAEKGLLETPCSNDFTLEFLRRTGFEWPEITDRYLDQFLTALDAMGFFW